MTDTMADQLPDEPTGTTIDGTPWDEARPPHLPDTVTRPADADDPASRWARSWSGS